MSKIYTKDKKEFYIEISEFTSRIIQIGAKDIDSAIAKVRKDYLDGKIVLDHNDHLDYNIQLHAVQLRSEGGKQ